MKINVLTSGSKGNVTAVEVGGEIILLDCGKAVAWTLERLNWQLPRAILVTHEHGDHAKATADWLKRGVDIYLTKGTIEALELKRRHNLHAITAGAQFRIGGVTVKAIPAIHDATEPVNFILSDDTDRILYATDTGAIPPLSGTFTKIIVEANFSEPILLASSLDAHQKRRVLENHLSIEQAITFLKDYPTAEVHLIHISKRHGDGEEFRARAIAAIGNENITIN